MSSEELRQAAALMRERAEAATPGPWEVLWNAVAYVDTVADPSDPTGQTPMQHPEKIADANQVDRAHIASWHPAVALAVADWLEAEAQAHFHIGDEVRSVYDQPNMGGPALAVARAYLGSAS